MGMKKADEEEGSDSKSVQSSTATAKTIKMPLSNSYSSSNTKRLLFDRRYGWVIDEWKEPSQEALAAGRGMFCIVPLAKGLIEMASHSLDVATNSAIKILESRDNLFPQLLQATIGNQFQQLRASVQKPNLSFLGFKTKPFTPTANTSLQQHTESSKLQEP